MLPLQFGRDRLRALLNEIARLKESEFPYQHSKSALQLLEQRFQADLAILDGLDEKSDPDAVRQQCALTLDAIVQYLPLLGFNMLNPYTIYHIQEKTRIPTQGSGSIQGKLDCLWCEVCTIMELHPFP